MKRYLVLLCAVLIACPALLIAQDGGDIAANDYSDYFGENNHAATEGPHSLGEARKTGRAYRLGQTGSIYRKPTRNAHTVQQGDTLWDISDRYFGDPWHWPELWSYNPEITNPHWIYPLDQVRLSGEALDQDQAVAAEATGAETAGLPRKPRTVEEFKEPTHGLATDMAPRVTVPPNLFKGDTIFLRDEGYLDDDEIKASGTLEAANAEQMLLSNTDTVYVRFKQGQKVEVGKSYTIYRPIHKWEREVGEHGKLVRIQGAVLISSYDTKTSVGRGMVVESIDPIERGMPVTLMERRFILAQPKPNPTNLVARIVGTTQPRALLAYGNVVFLNVGEGHGIVPGNRFFVVRRGDNWMDVLQRPAEEMGNIVPVPPYKKQDLPKEVVAELRVVNVRKKITIAVITRAETDVFQGESVEMRVGF